MLVRTDDEMWRVDRTYLGPKGRRLPWRATYRAYGIWLAVTTAGQMLLLQLGISPRFISVVALLTIGVLVTIRLGQHLDHDRPLMAVVPMVWHEITAPREPRAIPTVREVGVRVRHYGAEDVPPARWWERRKGVEQ